jgi:hypothetical protein
MTLDTIMSEQDDKPPLDYRRPSPTDTRSAARFERNGWIGLAITLAVCTVVAIVYIIRH